MMRHTFTVQIHEKEPFERWRIMYEGPVESTASVMFAVKTKWALAIGCRYKVTLNDKTAYEGEDLRVAKTMFYAFVRSLSDIGKRTWSTTFEVRNGDLGGRFTVRPFEERLMGGDPQSGVTRTQFSDPADG